MVPQTGQGQVLLMILEGLLFGYEEQQHQPQSSGKMFQKSRTEDWNWWSSLDLDKVLKTLNEAWAALKVAQKKHKQNHDAGLHLALAEHEEKAKDSDDPKAAKKAAVAVEPLIWKHHTKELYTRINQVMKPNSGRGLQWVDVQKKDDQGNIIWDATRAT